MAFDAGSIVAKMRLNTKEFVTPVSALFSPVTKFDKRVGSLLTGGAVIGGLEGIRRAATKAFESMERGARLEEIDLGFQRITDSAGEMNAILSGTRRVAGSLANSEIKQLANQLELVGIGAEKLPRFAEIAEAIADSTGRSTKQVLEDLVSGTARASDRMLTMLGIRVDLTEAATEEAKQQMFLNAVLERGDTIIQDIGNSAVTSADHLDTFKTSWRNLFEEIDKGLTNLAPVLGMIGTPRGLLRLMMPGRVFGGGAGDIGFGELEGPSVRSAGAQRASAAAASAAQAAIAAQRAAKAYFDNLLFQSKGSVGGQPRVSGGMGPTFVNPAFQVGLDMEQILDPGLTNPAFDNLKQNFIDIGSLVSGLTDSIGTFFEELVTGSGNAGRAFFSSMAMSIGGIASMLGDTIIQGSLGMIALGALNPFAAIAAGVALKALGGLFRGIANKNAPAFSTATAPTRPRGDQFEEQRGTTVINVDNFVGNKAWMEEFIKMINRTQRNTGVRVNIHGAAA